LPPRLDPTLRLKGWSDLGQRLEEIAAQLPDPDRVFYFGSYYDVTAELAFYAPGQPAAYCADFGRRQSQYDLWPDPTGRVRKAFLQEGKGSPQTGEINHDPHADKTGWDALYVATEDRVPHQLHTMCDSMTSFRYQTTHRGRPGRTFTIVLLRNFNGQWPQAAHARF